MAFFIVSTICLSPGKTLDLSSSPSQFSKYAIDERQKPDTTLTENAFQISRRPLSPRRPGHLTKPHGEQLVPAGKVLDVLVAIILFHDAKEDKLIQEFDHLSENVRTCVHIGSYSSAKLSSNRCALKNLATF